MAVLRKPFSDAIERAARRRRMSDDEVRVASALAPALVEIAEALAAEAVDGLDRAPAIARLLATARRTAKRTARGLGWA